MRNYILIRDIALAVCFFLFWSVGADGQSTQIKARTHKMLLVINSYYEGEPWANDIIEPIANYISTIDDLGCEIVNLNCSMVSDSTAYNDVADNLFQSYVYKRPSYIVMLGTFAFTLRDRIRETWGDVPILLVTYFDTFGTLEDQYTSNQELMDVKKHARPLEELRDDYNFTALVVPNFYEETVDLMLNMIPDMNEFVFFSTNIYAARYTASVIRDKLKREHPEIEFKWVKASMENSEVLREYFNERKPQAGILLSSWVYSKPSLRGYPTLTSNDVRLMVSSKNPVFTLREPYRMYGSIGGVYENNEEVHQYMRDMVDRMIADSTALKEAPFMYSNDKDIYINYRLMQEYDLKESNCPEGTKFYVKPLTYWEQYLWQSIVLGLIALIVIGTLWWKVSSQNTRIKRLRYNKLFLENMPVPFAKADIMFDKQGKVKNINYTTKNAAFEKLIEENAVPGNPFLLFPADFIAEKISQLMEKKQNVTFTYLFEETNTCYGFTLCSVMERNERYGTINVVDIFVTDLTNRYWMEKRLRHFVSKLDLALTAARMVSWQWDFKRGVIIYDDRGQMERTKSYKVTNNDFDEWEIKEEDFLMRLHPDDRETQIKAYDDIRAGRITNYNLQFRFMKKDNTAYDWVEVFGTLTDVDDNGNPLIVTGSMRNITERITSNQMLLEALDKAREADRMKSAFIANMSHEIRTPLNAIVGFSNLLSDDISEEERTEFKNIINLNNELLLSLINDILDLSKIESNTIDVHISTTDVNAIIDSAEQTVQFRLQPGVSLYTHKSMESCFTEADPTRLTQVITNFLTNACKFTSQGQIDLGYELTSDGKMLYFYVQDTGIGINDEYKAKVFERFVKLNDFVQGTGLGLAICNRLVELMGGKIGVDSEGEGKGSRFWFTIPYKPLNGQGEAHDEDSETKATEKTEASQDNGLPLILIAEDNDSNFKLVAHILKDEYRIIRATNGEEAIEMYTESKPSLILMDISMPIMDGYEATKEIRKIAPFVPIIAVTAYAYESDRHRILNNGFNAYVSKPINSTSIKEAIKRVQGGGRMRQ